MAAAPPDPTKELKEHLFWDTQPVPRHDDKVEGEGPYEVKTVAEVSADPYPLASVLEWCSPDMSDAAQLQEVYELLRDNYVEDDDSLFRFNYSKEFLSWATQPPGHFPDWSVGVRKKSDKKLLAYISGIPCNIAMGDVKKRICEINFLCVHKSLRHKRLAPILIKEVTRRVNLRDIWQAVYTAGIELPKPFASCQYFHRALNPQKLVEIRFSKIPPQYERFQRPMDAMKRNFALPARQIPKLKPMVDSDVEGVHRLLTAYLAKFRVAPAFDVEEARHWLMPRDGVVYAYALHGADGAVTDFVSFYALNSTVIGNPKHSDLRAAYGYYYAANTMPNTTLLNEALILARDEGFDVFNCLTLLDNLQVLSDLKFGQGDGHLRYYFYNWRFPPIKSGELGLVML